MSPDKYEESRKFNDDFKDNVDKEFVEHVVPNHYAYAEIEPIDIIENDFTVPEYIGFAKGLILKYMLRAEHKNNLEDYIKSKYYLDRLVSYLEKHRDEYNEYIKNLKK